MHNTDSKNNYDIDTGSATRRTQSGGNVSMPPELFEKLYLQPQHPVSGDLRTRFGNPTPLYVSVRQCLRHENPLTNCHYLEVSLDSFLD